MKRTIISLGFFGLLLLPLQGVLAAPITMSGSEHITDFSSTSGLAPDGTLSVSESITVDFGSSPHHGLFRNIPTIERSGSNVYYYQFNLESVSSPTGAPAGLDAQGQINDVYQLKIGDPNQTVSGIQTYVITYQLKPFPLRNGDVDRVNLNITGQSWEYPIDHASLRLTLPVAPLATPVCYTGLTNSTDHNCTVSLTGNVVQVDSTTELLPTGEGMTVDMNLPANSFTSYLIAGKKPPLAEGDWIDVVTTLAIWILGLIALGGSLWKWSRNRRLQKAQTIYAQYESPDGLTPGQIGLLADSKSNMTEFSATVVDLAVRGYLKITRTQSQKLFISSTDYTFEALKPSAGLTDYELVVYNLLFGRSTVDTLHNIASRSNSNANSAAIRSMRQLLGQSLKAAGYYGGHSNLVDHSVWSTALIALATVTIGLAAPVDKNIFFHILAAGMVIYALFMLTRYPQLTPAGAAEWAKVEGFKLYLRMAEKDRLDFSDAPERTPERFNALLPYAVALKVEKQWAKQFEGIDVSPANGWYGGSGGATFSSAAFAGSFASSFGSTVNSSFAGSSGSGGAGGGGGGGGGGGW